MSELKYTVGQMNNIMSSSLEYFMNWKEAEKENKRLTARIAELEYQLEDWTNNGWAEDYKARIAELEAEKCVLIDQQREVKNILIDKNFHIDSLYEEGYKLQQRIAELEAAQRWIPVGERLPDGGHREFYEVACIYQDFGELALFSKGRWVICEGENVYDVTKRVKFWRKRQYLPDEVIAVLSKGEMKPEVQE